jgi:hypothetical protein
MDYYQGYEDAMRQARASRGSGLLGSIARLLISVLYSAFIYVPLLIFGYYLANQMSPLYSGDIFIKVALTLLIAYLLFASIYFLKGILIALRSGGRFSWILIWILCVMFTCAIQTVIAQSWFEDFLAGTNLSHYEIWSWFGSAIIAFIIYSHYRFLTNVAPRSVFWSYELGFLFGNNYNKGGDAVKAHKSVNYFENAPLKVSYKRDAT